MDEWRFVRTNQYYISGDKSAETGNQHFGLNVINDRQAKISIRITGTNQWVESPAEFSRNQEKLALTFSQTHYRKAVRLIRIAPCKYQVNITADEPVAGKEIFWKETVEGNVICGIDLNLDHLTAALIDREGQFKDFKTFMHPNLGELPKNKSKQQIFLLAKEVVKWCKSKGVSAIVLEDLNIAQSPEQSTTMNRRTVTFSYRQLHDAIVRHGQRQGLNFKQVNPAYTSWIGDLKYQESFGVSRHIAAAFVIARRGLGLKEALPAIFLEILPKIAEEYEARNDKARSDKTKERYTSRINTLRNWKKNSPKTTSHAWKLWAVLLNYWKENKSKARASHAVCGNTSGRNYLVSLRRSGGNTPPVLCLGTTGKSPGQDLSSLEIWTTQGTFTVTSDAQAPFAAERDGEVPF